MNVFHPYFDEDGHPIPLMEWAAKYEDAKSRVVEESSVWHGGRLVRLVTMYHGFVDHEAGTRLYGTARIYADGQIEEVGQWDDREAAIEGHARLLNGTVVDDG